MDDSLEILYRKHRQGMYSFALSLTRSPQAAEDAIHDAFAGFYQKMSMAGQTRSVNAVEFFRLKDHDSLVAYVYRAIRNRAIDRQRTGNRQQRLAEMLFQTLANGHSDASTFESNQDDQSERLKDAIEALPEQDRETIMLKTYSDLTFDQVGEVLDISPKTVASRYRRALKKLESQLKGNQ